MFIAAQVPGLMLQHAAFGKYGKGLDWNLSVKRSRAAAKVVSRCEVRCLEVQRIFTQGWRPRDRGLGFQLLGLGPRVSEYQNQHLGSGSLESTGSEASSLAILPRKRSGAIRATWMTAALLEPEKGSLCGLLLFSKKGRGGDTILNI